jgi:hypothetical protein
VDSAVYYKYRLRSLAEIAPIFNAAVGAVLLKPLNEMVSSSIEELRSEYKDYAVQFVWIFRDPANVIYSMHRQGWLPRSQFDHHDSIASWISRNRLALEFQQHRPTEIALVRYEDCYADPNVFRKLCAWLDIAGQSLFRKDSAGGRRHIPLDARQKIDAAARPTLHALDAARTFRARTLYRWKLAAATGLSELAGNWQPSGSRSDSLSVSEWDTNIANVAACLPSQLSGLRFWLDAGNEPTGDHQIADFIESGPRRMQARGDPKSLFHIPNLNGRYALFFPIEKAAARQQAKPGLLRFGRRDDWKFLFDGTPFSIFALFKPYLQGASKQQRAVVLRIGPTAPAPAMILEWDGKLRAAKVILRFREAPAPIFAQTPSGSHPIREWRLIHFQCGGRDDPTLSISVNAAPNAPVVPLALPPLDDGHGLDCTLDVGGNEAESDALFMEQLRN